VKPSFPIPAPRDAPTIQPTPCSKMSGVFHLSL